MISKDKLKKQFELEIKHFEETHKKSKALYIEARESLLQGVPLNWMVRWMGNFPISVVDAKGVHVTCADGHDYIDFCLGDTGSLVGHAPQAAAKAINDQFAKGASFMLPTADAAWNGRELQSRFGMKYWQFATSATDANRFALRLARQVTGRSKIIVFNWCYHGTVDETIASMAPDGKTIARKGNLGQPVDPEVTTKVIEWNDIDALEAALKDRDVAAVLAEPVMTNIGVVLPKPGFHDAMRELTIKYDTPLIIDETHTMCAGVGGYTKDHGLKPDMITCGKFLASGIPAGAYGFTEEFGKKATAVIEEQYGVAKGIGGTLAANALTMAAMRATLGEILTQDFYARNIPLAKKFNEGVQKSIDEFDLPWSTTQLGCRTEYVFSREIPKNGTDAYLAKDQDLDWYMHLASLNRGIIMTPFHNMALITNATTLADIDRHTEVFREIISNIAE